MGNRYLVSLSEIHGRSAAKFMFSLMEKNTLKGYCLFVFNRPLWLDIETWVNSATQENDNGRSVQSSCFSMIGLLE